MYMNDQYAFYEKLCRKTNDICFYVGNIYMEIYPHEIKCHGRSKR